MAPGANLSKLASLTQLDAFGKKANGTDPAGPGPSPSHAQPSNGISTATRASAMPVPAQSTTHPLVSHPLELSSSASGTPGRAASWAAISAGTVLAFIASCTSI